MCAVKILPSNTSKTRQALATMHTEHDQIVRVVADLTLLQSVRNPPGTSAGSSGFLCLNLWGFTDLFYQFAKLCLALGIPSYTNWKLLHAPSSNRLVAQHQTFPSELAENFFLSRWYHYLCASKTIVNNTLILQRMVLLEIWHWEAHITLNMYLYQLATNFISKRYILP